MEMAEVMANGTGRGFMRGNQKPNFKDYTRYRPNMLKKRIVPNNDPAMYL